MTVFIGKKGTPSFARPKVVICCVLNQNGISSPWFWLEIGGRPLTEGPPGSTWDNLMLKVQLSQTIQTNSNSMERMCQNKITIYIASIFSISRCTSIVIRVTAIISHTMRIQEFWYLPQQQMFYSTISRLWLKDTSHTSTRLLSYQQSLY